MTASTPSVFQSQCAVVMSMLDELQREYRWAHGIAHDRSVGDEVMVTAGTADPTMTVLLSKRRARRACEEANQAVVDAEKAVNAAINRLSASLKIVDPPPRFEPLRYKADATRADIREAKEAQLRRAARGEAVPE